MNTLLKIFMKIIDKHLLNISNGKKRVEKILILGHMTKLLHRFKIITRGGTRKIQIMLKLTIKIMKLSILIKWCKDQEVLIIIISMKELLLLRSLIRKWMMAMREIIMINNHKYLPAVQEKVNQVMKVILRN